MVVFASVALIPPAFNRLVFAFNLPPFFTNVGWLLLVLGVPTYDRRKEGGLTAGSKVGLALVGLSIVSAIIGTGLNDAIRRD